MPLTTAQKKSARTISVWIKKTSRVARALALLALSAAVRAEDAAATADSTAPGPDAPWIDRFHSWTYNRLWRSAMGFDHFFGSDAPGSVYQEVYGSLAPALLWDQFHGFQPKLRFQVNVPLPRLSERVHAIIGRVNPDEYIAGRAPESGAFQRQYGPIRDDETILGLVYRTPSKNSSGFGLGAGIRIRTPLDPYVKGDYTYVYGMPTALLFTFKQTLFWQQSENVGTTSRIDLDHFLSPKALLRFSTAATLSQKSEGLRGFASLSLLRSLPERRAVTGNLSIDWESRAPVALHDFGAILAYRQSIAREWLILEVRSSLTWPKETLGAARTHSWGLGVGLEMLIGTTQFQARPVTF
jgi:hypothetical protein